MISRKGQVWFPVLMIILAIALVGFLTLWTDRNMDYLLTWIKGKPVDCPTWLSFLITVVGNGATTVFNIIMEVIRLVR